MRPHRVYAELPLEEGRRVRLPAQAARHLLRVLRLRPGDSVVLFNGDGRDYSGELVGAGPDDASVQLSSAGELEPPPPLAIHLGLGISRGERMDFALQKAVELGVSGIAPLFTDRSMVRLSGDRLAKREAHWRGVVVAACEQSGRRRIPELHPSRPLEAWLQGTHPCPLLLDPRGTRTLPGLSPPGAALTLLIGPEGGLAPGERRRAEHAGFSGVRLGPRVLRTETAPLAALAVVQALWGDLAR